jgi:hypothetical protein
MNDTGVDRRSSRGPDLVKLWAENETFREDIQELSQLSREIGPFEKEYNADMKTLKREFYDATRLATETIRQQKKVFMNRAKEIKCRGKYKRAIGRFSSKYNRICGSYDIGFWELHRNMARVRGAPKFRHRYGRSYRHSDNLFYFFRVRI